MLTFCSVDLKKLYRALVDSDFILWYKSANYRSLARDIRIAALQPRRTAAMQSVIVGRRNTRSIISQVDSYATAGTDTTMRFDRVRTPRLQQRFVYLTWRRFLACLVFSVESSDWGVRISKMSICCQTSETTSMCVRLHFYEFTVFNCTSCRRIAFFLSYRPTYTVYLSVCLSVCMTVSILFMFMGHVAWFK